MTSIESLAQNTPSSEPSFPRLDFRVVAIALGLSAATFLAVAIVGPAAGSRSAILLLLGLALGATLFHAAFGFSSSWRAFLVEGNPAGLKAQLIMLAVASLLFFPALAAGTLFGKPIVGAVAPLGVSVLVGAFLFGLGMQLGGGCASGTLYALGGGSLRMAVTLLFFMIGSLLGAAQLPFWLSQPALGSVALWSALGLWPSLALQLGALALLWLAVTGWARWRGFARQGAAGDSARQRSLAARLLFGPWSLVAGALALAALNFLTLAASGHPWNVSFGYSLWGAALAGALGFQPQDLGAFWTWPYPARALELGIFGEDTSIMNLGIVLGALLASGLAGRFAPRRRLTAGPLLASAIGGLLMGFGARLAFGCNVGAFFSGIASGSLHGWLWFAAALPGSALGIALLPLFGLGRGWRRGP